MNLRKKYKKMPKVLKRTMWAKSIGFGISLIAFLALIAVGFYQSLPLFCIAILLWYPAVGAFIGLAGVMDKHPLLGKMGIWRGVMIGGMMNLLLVLLSSGTLFFMADTLGYQISLGVLLGAAILEGAIIGGIIDWIVTDKFGEGEKLMKK